MPLDGFLLDVQPDFERNKVTSWIKTDSGPCVRVRDAFEPAFFVHGARGDLAELRRRLLLFRAVRCAEFEQRRLFLGSPQTREVLKVTVRDLREFSRLPKRVDAAGDFCRFTLFNVELSLPQQYMFERGLFPTARLRLSCGPTFEVTDSRFSLDYVMPPFRVAFLSAEPRAAAKIPTPRDPVAFATLRTRTVGADDEEEERVTGDEEDVLKGLQELLARRDPDLLVTDAGDSFLIPYLFARARAAGLAEDAFFLGREPQRRRAARRSRSYFSYGRIVYKPAAFTLRGRVHIDRHSSFSFGEAGLWGTVELARLSGLPLQAVARQSPGTAISAMEVHQAIDDGCLVMWKKNVPEEFKGLDQLFLADRGGFIFEPKVGVHSGVAELDFTSLYPNIMVRYNLSLETLNCRCCPESRRRVPVLGYPICERTLGLIPRVLAPLISRRTLYKRLKKELKASDPKAAEIYDERCRMLKWVLVTSFGYTGYKNARFGKIECHEAINAFARETMLDTMRIAELSGFEVLHGIVDSIWLKARRPSVDVERLVEYLGRAIGIPVSFEGIYRWIVFLPNKLNTVGALNRYYGLFEDGEMKLRGIELRKHDTPKFLRKLQTQILEVLCRASDGEAFLRLVPEAIEVARRYKERLKRGEVEAADLVFTKNITQHLEGYRQFNDRVACLKQLRAHGVEASPGESVRYVVANARSHDWRTRVCAAELLDDETPYDARYYCRQVDRTVESLFDFRRVAPAAAR